MVRRDMYQRQSEFGAGVGHIDSKFYVDVPGQVRIGFTAFYTGQSRCVYNYLWLNRFKPSSEVSDRFKINLPGLNTSKQYITFVKA